MEQYRRDGRIVRGIQRGAHSFMTCTAMSTLELTNRLVQTIQVNYMFTKQSGFLCLWPSVFIGSVPFKKFIFHIRMYEVSRLLSDYCYHCNC